MKNLCTLKQLISIFYIGLYVVFYGCVALAVAVYFAGENIGITSIYGMDNVNVNAKGVMIFMVLGLTLYYFFILAIKSLKDSLPFITSENPFNADVCAHFYRAGKMMIGVGIGYLAFHFLAPLVLLSELKIRVDHVTVSGLFLIVIGLFFLFFSEAFGNASRLKKENDLTI